jgi:predicted phosphodiesterase
VRLAVFSDIHAHADALDAVLHAAVAARVDALWCLGDMIGTGPDAAHVVERVRSFCALALLGNHDYDAAARLALSPEDLEWMGRRRPAARREGVQCWHGSPRQPVREYVTAANAAACLSVQREPLGLVGHTHAPAAFLEGARRPVPIVADEPLSLATGKWLLNPGAVGAPLPPRGEWWDSLDADPHADWLELDLGERTATWHRTPFDPAPCRARARQLSE